MGDGDGDQDVPPDIEARHDEGGHDHGGRQGLGRRAGRRDPGWSRRDEGRLRGGGQGHSDSASRTPRAAIRPADATNRENGDPSENDPLGGVAVSTAP